VNGAPDVTVAGFVLRGAALRGFNVFYSRAGVFELSVAWPALRQSNVERPCAERFDSFNFFSVQQRGTKNLF